MEEPPPLPPTIEVDVLTSSLCRLDDLTALDLDYSLHTQYRFTPRAPRGCPRRRRVFAGSRGVKL